MPWHVTARSTEQTISRQLERTKRFKEKFHHGAERWTTGLVEWECMPSLAASLEQRTSNPALVLTRRSITGICLHLAGISTACRHSPTALSPSVSTVSCTMSVITHIRVSLYAHSLPNSNPCQSQGAFHVGPSPLHLIMNLITASINHLLRGSYLKPAIDLFQCKSSRSTLYSLQACGQCEHTTETKGSRGASWEGLWLWRCCWEDCLPANGDTFQLFKWVVDTDSLHWRGVQL